MKQSKHPISLKTWFNKYSLIPFCVLSILTFILIFSLISREFENKKTLESTGMQQLADLISLGMQQKNRSLIESVLDTTRWQYGSLSSWICENNKIIISSTNLDAHCTADSSSSLFYRNSSLPIPGFKNATFYMKTSKFHNSKIFILFIFIFIFLVSSFFTLIFFIQSRIRKDILTPFSKNLEQEETPLNIIELEKVRLLQKELFNKKIETELAQKIVDNNQQIAHDIRSPLTSLGILSSTAQSLSVDDKEILQLIIQRIKNILSKLEKKSASTEENLSLVEFLKNIEMEKSLEYQNIKNQLEITTIISEEVKSKYSNLKLPLEFNEIFSNLINNAVESKKNNSDKISILILVKLDENKKLAFSVEDNGAGIDPMLLCKLPQKGLTQGKENGSGFGLYNAKCFIESLDGSLEITSQLNSGTKVTLTL